MRRNQTSFDKNLGFAALQQLSERALRIATAESCTGGLLAFCFTKNAGASKAFMGGIISYANYVKENNLNVSAQKLKTFGAVSQEVVSDMLKGALEKFDTDIALATSGIAGPDGGSEAKPVGLVFIGMQRFGYAPIIEKFLFSGDREEIQKQACIKALEILLKNL